MGIPVDQAYVLSYFSQLPDERISLDAVKVGVLSKIFVFDSTYKETILSTLHSLHGGNEDAVLKRRTDLSQLIRKGIENNSLMDWEIGIIIHSLGDSFSHVKKNKNGKLEAYGHGVGHLFHGHKPDIIAEYPETYKDYLRTLYIALSGNDTGFEEKLMPLLSYIQNLSKNKNFAIRQMEHLAENLGFGKDEYFKVESAWDDVMKNRYILMLLKKMEREFEGNSNNKTNLTQNPLLLYQSMRQNSRSVSFSKASGGFWSGYFYR